MNRLLCAFILLPNLVSAALLTDKVTPNFLPDINKIRRQFAKEHSVPDMHEWVCHLIHSNQTQKSDFQTWSKDLETILHPITVEKVRETQTSGADWRYVVVNSYETVNTELETKLKEFAGKTEDEQKGQVDNRASYSQQELEFVQPLQKFVACKPTDISGKIYVLCLVGPKGEFEFVNKERPTGEAGTKCDSGYENDDGLCVVAKPKTTTENPEKKTENPKKTNENPRKPSEAGENPSEATTVENQGVKFFIPTVTYALFSTIWLIFY
ncbi:hypothetical protein CRE_15682 [Caenorhabditis remanei]|uniref:Uncharacterized protein n=1 Tax=Caenorhabditis remanei TaxID=31234 RepID=E3N865_CAERE|nr:hypothetical protein CRE_15682 [Caenorhabditis remanei]